jgi:hypothetical protein
MRLTFFGTSLAVAALATLMPAQAQTPVPLQNATATYSQTNPSFPGLWDPNKTIDGATAGSFTSWAISRVGGSQAETIVWQTQSDLSVTAATPLLFSLYQQEYITAGQQNLGRFRLSFTTDARTGFADGLANGGNVSANWVVIAPQSASGSNGATFTTLGDSSILVSGANCCYPFYSVSAAVTASHITGFRLEALKDASLPSGGPGRESTMGNFHLSEFVVAVVPEPASWAYMAAGLAALLGGIGRRRGATT